MYYCISDDDSEPILGSWFEETTSAASPVTVEAEEVVEFIDDTKLQEKPCQSFVPEKREPDGVSLG